jgi:hypothetical protein
MRLRGLPNFANASDRYDRPGCRCLRYLRTKLFCVIVSWLGAAAIQLKSEARHQPEMSEVKSDPAAI